LVLPRQARCRFRHVPPVALDVSPIELAHERLPELAIAAGLLGNEEGAAHRSAFARAGEPTTAPFPMVRPGTRTAALRRARLIAPPSPAPASPSPSRRRAHPRARRRPLPPPRPCPR